MNSNVTNDDLRIKAQNSNTMGKSNTTNKVKAFSLTQTNNTRSQKILEIESILAKNCEPHVY